VGKCQVMFAIILTLCFVLKIFRCSDHYAPKFLIYKGGGNFHANF